MPTKLFAIAMVVLLAGCSAGQSPVMPRPMTTLAVSPITIAPVTIQPQVVPLNNGYIYGPAADVPVQGAFAVEWSSLDQTPVITIGIASGTP
jgi:hypothetical protein